MSLHLLQVEQLSKASQVGGGRQQFSCVPKVHPDIGSNGRHFVAAFFQFRSAPGLKQVRHEVALQQNMVVTGSAKKVVFFLCLNISRSKARNLYIKVECNLA